MSVASDRETRYAGTGLMPGLVRYPRNRVSVCREQRDRRAAHPSHVDQHCVASLGAVLDPGSSTQTDRRAVMADLVTTTALAVVAAGFLVGVVVGLTGMGGGALMTPALIFLGVGDAATVVTADLTAAAVYKTGGAIVHKREGVPQHEAGDVAGARLGPDGAARAAPDQLGRSARRARPDAQALHRLRAALRRADLRAAAVREPAPDARPATSRATTTRSSGRCRRCSSAPSAACWSASPASARAR